MSISFHCECCKKKIKAPDEAGGKWGNCPYCKHRCYIPTPRADDEPELRLAPVDGSEETKIGMLMHQTHSVTRDLLQTASLDEGSRPGQDAANEKEVIKICILYIRQMADGELSQAAGTFEKLKIYKKTSLRLLSSMARAERPEPELSDLPDGVLHGLIRNASTKLSS